MPFVDKNDKYVFIKPAKDYVEGFDKEYVQTLDCLGVFGIKENEGKYIYFITKTGDSLV